MIDVASNPLAGMPAGLLHNESTGRYHPIVFRPAPMASADAHDPPRYKSRGHHTAGFDTRDEAIASMKEAGWDWREAEWGWDGTGVPAMVEFFPPRS